LTKTSLKVTVFVAELIKAGLDREYAALLCMLCVFEYHFFTLSSLHAKCNTMLNHITKQACVRAKHKSIMGTFSQDGPFGENARCMIPEWGPSCIGCTHASAG
jgi:hypothetical protein